MIARIVRVAVFTVAILAVCGFDRCGEPKSELGWITVSTDRGKFHRDLAVVGEALDDQLFTVSGGIGEPTWEVGAVEPGTYTVVGTELRTPLVRGGDGEDIWPVDARVVAYAPETVMVAKRARSLVRLGPSKGGSIIVRVPGPAGGTGEVAGAFVTVSRRAVQVLKPDIPSREVFEAGPVTWTTSRVGGSVRIDGVPPGTYEVGVEGGGPVKVPYSSTRVTVTRGGTAEVVAGR